MIVFQNWHLTADPFFARQFDHLTQRLEVTGSLPENWNWEMLIQSGDYFDTIPLMVSDAGAGTDLTADQLALSGCYSMQLRGKLGEQIRHTNVVTVMVSGSLSGDKQWPVLPGAFTKLEERIRSINDHPPVAGENGYWMLWNPDRMDYERSQFLTPDGGYYIPVVDEEGVLNFTASKPGMAEVSSKNIRGPQGVQGEKGDAGAVIVPNVDESGMMSFTAMDGAVVPAPVNVRGPQGEQGIQGEKGLDGADGKSAWRFAAEAGYTGTEEEFSQLLNQVSDHMFDNDNPHGVTAKQIEAYTKVQTDELLRGKVNRNLLDNWCFANPVNQRGQTEYTGKRYTIDRWVSNVDSLSVSLKETGLQISCSESSGARVFEQYFEDGFVPKGNTYTLSVLVSELTGSFRLLAYTKGYEQVGNILIDSVGLHSVTFAVPESGANLFFISFFGSAFSTTVNAVKLELGDTQTLARQNENGNWGLNEIPNYAEELAKCQRYYRKSWTGNISNSGMVPFLRAAGANSQPAVFWGNPMRATPTIKIYSIFGQANAITNWSNDTDVVGVHGNYYKSRYGFALSELGGTTAGYAYGFHYEASADL